MALVRFCVGGILRTWWPVVPKLAFPRPLLELSRLKAVVIIKLRHAANLDNNIQQKGNRMRRLSALPVLMSCAGLFVQIASAQADETSPKTDGAAVGTGTAGSNKKPGAAEAKNTTDPATQAGKSAAEGAKWQESRWVLDSGEPTYRISDNGMVDWATYEGFKRYHAECHTCHGPNGLGSTFAPALADTLKTVNYEQFKEVVANGKTSGAGAMPAFASNPNVMCYIDDIYTYLKARADGVLKAGDTQVKDRVAKSDTAQSNEKTCMQ